MRNGRDARTSGARDEERQRVIRADLAHSRVAVWGGVSVLKTVSH